jgi:hypothetical protein
MESNIQIKANNFWKFIWRFSWKNYPNGQKPCSRMAGDVEIKKRKTVFHSLSFLKMFQVAM